MRTKGSATELEARRRRAAEYFQAGESLRTVADRFGVNLSSAKRWKRAWSKGGVDALSAKPHPGGVSKLTIEQRDALVDLVVAGPLAAGFKTDLWTCERIATLIRRQFGVAYHRGHLARMLHELGFSPQKPRTIAREQDAEVVDRWRREDWPRIKKMLADAAQALSFSTKLASCCSR
jgi:transposase